MLNKLLSGLLATLLCLSALVSCASAGGAVTETTTPTMTESAATDIPASIGAVKLDGAPIELTADYTLLIGDRNNDAILVLANDLKKRIATKTGMNLAIGREGTKKEKELILGFSESREVSAGAYESLGRGEYAVYIHDQTPILSGWTNDDLSAAADLLVEQALVQENGKWMIYPHALQIENSVSMAADLSAYRIIYPADAGTLLKKTVVSLLQDQLHATFGIMPKAFPDSEPATEYEIVLGDTNRTPDTVRAQLGDAQNADLFRYVIAAEGHRLYLFAHSDIALHTAADELCDYVIPQVGPKLFCLTEESHIAGKPSTKDKAELAEGADLRVMSYNILHPTWGDAPISGRDINLAKILLYYMPDVVGLQEVNSSWHSAIKRLLVDTGYYQQACRMNRTGAKTNMTTFLYNPRTVKLIDEYVLDMDAGSDIRVFSVAVFEQLSDGRRFVVTNSHPAPTGQAENYKRNMASLLKIAEQELKKYQDLPVIMTGDFNTNEGSANYTALMSTAGVKDAKYDAEILDKLYNTYLSPGLGGTVNMGNNCIDHIFLNGQAHAKLYNFVVDHDVEHTSDHIPVYADIELK